MRSERKTALAALFKDAHSALKQVSALTRRTMTDLLDEIVVEQLGQMALQDDQLGDIARNFLEGRAVEEQSQE